MLGHWQGLRWRTLAIALAFAVWVGGCSSGAQESVAGREVRDQTDASDAGVVDVVGKPIAIAVTAPSGTLASYERSGGGTGSRWTCGYYGFENGSSSGISINIDYSTGAVQPVRGEGYGFLCHDEAGDLVHSWFGLYDPDDPFAGLFAAERAAELALGALQLSDPVVRLNPSGDQVVGLASWLWLDPPWAPADASARVTGVTSTVTATPLHVTWEMGDGSSVSCPGPGVAYDPALPRSAQASDCTFLYAQPSRARPGGVYRVVATVTYAASWAATNGSRDDFGTVTRSTTVPVRVVEPYFVALPL